MSWELSICGMMPAMTVEIASDLSDVFPRPADRGLQLHHRKRGVKTTKTRQVLQCQLVRSSSIARQTGLRMASLQCASKSPKPPGTELLGWINKVLGLKLHRVEQLGTGAVFCQLIDAYYPNAISINKVDFTASEEHETLRNWKVFQAGAAAAQLQERELDVQRLCKGSPPENIELLQWLYKHLAGHGPTNGYQPSARRAASAKGDPLEIPLPAPLQTPVFNIYLKSPGSPLARDAYQITSTGKVDVSGVTSKWRQGLAPPCLSPRRRYSPVPLLWSDYLDSLPDDGFDMEHTYSSLYDDEVSNHGQDANQTPRGYDVGTNTSFRQPDAPVAHEISTNTSFRQANRAGVVEEDMRHGGGDNWCFGDHTHAPPAYDAPQLGDPSQGTLRRLRLKTSQSKDDLSTPVQAAGTCMGVNADGSSGQAAHDGGVLNPKTPAQGQVGQQAVSLNGVLCSSPAHDPPSVHGGPYAMTNNPQRDAEDSDAELEQLVAAEAAKLSTQLQQATTGNNCAAGQVVQPQTPEVQAWQQALVFDSGEEVDAGCISPCSSLSSPDACGYGCFGGCFGGKAEATWHNGWAENEDDVLDAATKQTTQAAAVTAVRGVNTAPPKDVQTATQAAEPHVNQPSQAAASLATSKNLSCDGQDDMLSPKITAASPSTARAAAASRIPCAPATHSLQRESQSSLHGGPTGIPSLARVSTRLDAPSSRASEVASVDSMQFTAQHVSHDNPQEVAGDNGSDASLGIEQLVRSFSVEVDVDWLNCEGSPLALSDASDGEEGYGGQQQDVSTFVMHGNPLAQAADSPRKADVAGRHALDLGSTNNLTAALRDGHGQQAGRIPTGLEHVAAQNVLIHGHPMTANEGNETIGGHGDEYHHQLWKLFDEQQPQGRFDDENTSFDKLYGVDQEHGPTSCLIHDHDLQQSEQMPVASNKRLFKAPKQQTTQELQHEQSFEDNRELWQLFEEQEEEEWAPHQSDAGQQPMERALSIASLSSVASGEYILPDNCPTEATTSFMKMHGNPSFTNRPRSGSTSDDVEVKKLPISLPVDKQTLQHDEDVVGGSARIHAFAMLPKQQIIAVHNFEVLPDAVVAADTYKPSIANGKEAAHNKDSLGSMLATANNSSDVLKPQEHKANSHRHVAETSTEAWQILSVANDEHQLPSQPALLKGIYLTPRDSDQHPWSAQEHELSASLDSTPCTTLNRNPGSVWATIPADTTVQTVRTHGAYTENEPADDSSNHLNADSCLALSTTVTQPDVYSWLCSRVLAEQTATLSLQQGHRPTSVKQATTVVSSDTCNALSTTVTQQDVYSWLRTIVHATQSSHLSAVVSQEEPAGQPHGSSSYSVEQPTMRARSDNDNALSTTVLQQDRYSWLLRLIAAQQISLAPPAVTHTDNHRAVPVVMTEQDVYKLLYNIALASGVSSKLTNSDDYKALSRTVTQQDVCSWLHKLFAASTVKHTAATMTNLARRTALSPSVMQQDVHIWLRNIASAPGLSHASAALPSSDDYKALSTTVTQQDVYTWLHSIAVALEANSTSATTANTSNCMALSTTVMQQDAQAWLRNIVGALPSTCNSSAVANVANCTALSTTVMQQDAQAWLRDIAAQQNTHVSAAVAEEAHEPHSCDTVTLEQPAVLVAHDTSGLLAHDEPVVTNTRVAAHAPCDNCDDSKALSTTVVHQDPASWLLRIMSAGKHSSHSEGQSIRNDECHDATYIPQQPHILSEVHPTTQAVGVGHVTEDITDIEDAWDVAKLYNRRCTNESLRTQGSMPLTEDGDLEPRNHTCIQADMAQILQGLSEAAGSAFPIEDKKSQIEDSTLQPVVGNQQAGVQLFAGPVPSYVDTAMPTSPFAASVACREVATCTSFKEPEQTCQLNIVVQADINQQATHQSAVGTSMSFTQRMEQSDQPDIKSTGTDIALPHYEAQHVSSDTELQTAETVEHSDDSAVASSLQTEQPADVENDSVADAQHAHALAKASVVSCQTSFRQRQLSESSTEVIYRLLAQQGSSNSNAHRDDSSEAMPSLSTTRPQQPKEDAQTSSSPTKAGNSDVAHALGLIALLHQLTTQANRASQLPRFIRASSASVAGHTQGHTSAKPTHGEDLTGMSRAEPKQPFTSCSAASSDGGAAFSQLQGNVLGLHESGSQITTQRRQSEGMLNTSHTTSTDKSSVVVVEEHSSNIDKSAHLPPIPKSSIRKNTLSDSGARADNVGQLTSRRSFRMGENQLKLLRNGDVFKGKRVGSRKDGYGVYIFSNGDVYEGQFAADRMEGYGVYTFSHEGQYEGSWSAAGYHGAGCETFAQGSLYVGQYKSGLRCGWGVCKFFNGDYYEGQWLHGLRHGRGMQNCTDGSSYIGDYVQGKRHGVGVYAFPNGDKYSGQYNDDLPHGSGVYVFASGQQYEGQWVMGKKQGWSTYQLEDGSCYASHWVAGNADWVHAVNGSDKQYDSTAVDGWDAACVADVQASQRVACAVGAQHLSRKALQQAEEQAIAHYRADGEVQLALASAQTDACMAAAHARASRQIARELAAALDTAVEALLQKATLAQQQGTMLTPQQQQRLQLQVQYLRDLQEQSKQVDNNTKQG